VLLARTGLRLYTRADQLKNTWAIVNELAAAPAEGFDRCCATSRAGMGGFGEVAHQVTARRDHREAADAIEAKNRTPSKLLMRPRHTVKTALNKRPQDKRHKVQGGQL
jgi:hypothetical protein